MSDVKTTQAPLKPKKKGNKPAARAKAPVKLPTLAEKFASWQNEQKTDAGKKNTGALFFDNTPLDCLDAFPKQDANEVTAGLLQTGLWWWRRANGEHFRSIFNRPDCPTYSDILYQFYQDHFERSAYIYELRARYEGRYQWEFGRSWIFSSMEQRRMLDCLWPNTAPAQRYLQSMKGKPEWVADWGEHFNLKLNDTILKRQFMEAINRLRQGRNIEKPKKGGGIHRKQISWLPIELMDLHHYGMRKLNGSERSQVSKAFIAYIRVCAEAGIAP